MVRTPRIISLVLLACLPLALALAEDPVVPECGNCVLEWPEQCEDCNTEDGDGCRSDCTTEFCGDGIEDPQEQCDDGNTDPGDGCSPECTLETCGNGVEDPGEECDDGNTDGGDGCSETCQEEVCGNDVLDTGEECDDGNTDPGDGCRADCTLEVCGDGVLDPQEECDDGNTEPGDGCGPTCMAEECGNAVTDVGEECDDGNALIGDGCTPACKTFCDTPATEILNVVESGLEPALRKTIDNETEWCEFWDDVFSDDPSPPPCDASMIDFATELVIVGAVGPQPDDCHAVRLDCIDEVADTGRLRAVLSHEQPGPGCDCGDVVTRPAVAVKIDLPVTSVRILYEPRVVDCP